MAEVTYDDRSFLLDGERIWLVSGSLHYFRVPAEQWEDRLLKAKRAGLNCISTYVAWNVHEPREGEWDFSGDKDIAAFVRKAQDVGLYVILRPGPYICAEWDLGGLPSWLLAKSGMSLRTQNAAFMHYFDKYFAQVLPRLAELEVPNGGNIVLVQNENEYVMTTQPDRDTYLDFVTQLIRRAGFTVPIISCNLFSEPIPEGVVDCVNGCERLPADLSRMRQCQHDAPLLVTEYWDGAFDWWGGEHHTVDPQTAARRALEAVGCGAQVNHYMFHGGTNFEFYGSRLVHGHDAYQTTSYDYDAPIAEGGGLTEKYYLMRLVNLASAHLGPWLAQSMLPEEPIAGLENAPDVVTITGPRGNFCCVSNHGQEDVDAVRLALPSGQSIDVSLAPFGAALIPWDLQLPDGRLMDYSSLTPLGFFGHHDKQVLVLRGPAGGSGEVCIAGKVTRLTVPKDDEPGVEWVDNLQILVVNNDLASRTWPLDGEKLIFGPTYVGSTEEDLLHAPKAKQYYEWIFDEAKLATRKVKADTTKKPTAPKLDKWERIHIAPEPVSDDLEWQTLDRPRDVDRLGSHYGYSWYRIDIEQDRAKKRNLLLPECGDRAMLYLNGEPLGIWGRGPDAVREPISAPFKKGNNVLVAMVDNLGRYNFGPYMDEPKGLYGHVWDAKPLKTTKFKVKAAESFTKRIVPRHLAHMMDELETLPLVSAEMNITLTKPQSIHLMWTDIPHHLAVFCNDRPIGFYPKQVSNWGDLLLGTEFKKGKNTLQILAWGEADAKTFENIQMYSLLEPLSAGAQWGYRPWAMPEDVDSAREPIKNKPCWYTTTFNYTPTELPLFLSIGVAQKGQIFLNGRNLGRFWEVGPQPCYYLPEAWLEEGENEIRLFEEQGNWPQRCKLQYRPMGPYQD